MKQKFIIGFDWKEFHLGEFRVVSAFSEHEALVEFAKHYGIHEEIFLDDIYLRTVNMSFAEQFWSTENYEYFESKGLKSTEPSNEKFKANVRNFFGDQQDFADIYIAYFFDDNIPAEGSPEHRFSDEMLAYIWFSREAKDISVFKMADLEVGTKETDSHADFDCR